MRSRWGKASVFAPPGPKPPVIIALIVISFIVTLSSWFGQAPPNSLGDGVHRVLTFADLEDFLKTKDAFVSIEQGQLWRLITPIFVHFHSTHILFNMLMFYYFGKQIEARLGPIRLGLMIVTLAVISNCAQAYFGTMVFGKGINFGGMSGVVYGLFGYVWMKCRTEPNTTYVVDPGTVFILLAWFFLCWFEVVPSVKNVANYAHAGGLVVGMLLGVAKSLRQQSWG